eukprot:SAG22_NODE_7974_length_694_cov_0.726050_1_plen_49_part_01
MLYGWAGASYKISCCARVATLQQGGGVWSALPDMVVGREGSASCCTSAG